MSAQGYTNKIRTLTEARNNTVQKIGNIANKNVLEAAACTTPNYSVIQYRFVNCSGRFKPPCLKQ